MILNQKRPIYAAKEAYLCGKRGLPMNKRGLFMNKSDLSMDKRDLSMRQKRPMGISIPGVCVEDGRLAEFVGVAKGR